MTNKNDPAFPPIIESMGATQNYYATGKAGLTKREYFAAMALSGFAASPKIDGQDSLNAIGRGCVAWADALIAELNKETK